jgi:TPR repeat protein
MKFVKSFFVIAVLLATPVGAADFNTGLKAYKSGDYQTALKEWQPLANQGYARARNNLGVMYHKGQGVPQDYKLAVQWYRKASEQGEATAQNNVGVMYASGQGVLQDYVTAHMWANIATANGSEPILQDSITARMTSDQLAEAQRRARVCMASDYKNCD